jgi:thiamine-phosphate pyrophosphorylase
MARLQQAEAKHPGTRLYLITPVVENAAALSSVLGGTLAAADVAAVLLRLRGDDERALINTIKALAEIVQPSGAALVLDGHAGIVARAGADGAHLTGIDAFTAAVGTLKTARIAGCGGLNSRHDAMLAAEHGADYVMFGEPDSNGRRPSFNAIVERIEWWAEVFESPCVAYAAEFDEIAPFTSAGADFIAFGDPIWNDPAGPTAAIAAAAGQFAAREPAV